MAIYGFTHRRTRGATELAICASIVALWAAANAGERAAADLETMLFWANVQYLSYGFSPISWFTLVFRFNGKERFVTARNLALISIVPAITAILVWFDPQLGLVRHSFALRSEGGIQYIEKSYGPWFWFHYGFVYLVHLTGIGFLVAAISKRGSLFRRQSIYLLVSIGIVNLPNIAYVLGFSPIRHFDVTPMVFGFSTLILYWGIFRHKIFRIPPIARTKVFELMANGLLVVDESWNLVDANDAARRMLGLEGPECVGSSLRDRIPELASAAPARLPAGEDPWDDLSLRWELRMRRGAEERCLELDASRLSDSAYKGAWVLFVQDVTDLRRAREEIMRQREELAVAADRDKLSMELHDTLGQVLSFAVIQSGTVLREMGRGNYPLAASYVERVRDILKDSHEDLRGFVRGIRMSEYGALPLASILEKEAERFRQSCGIPVELELSAEGADLTPLQRSHLAKVAKEALNNIAKHARATRVRIGLAATGTGYRLFVEDDGVGIGAPGGSSPGGSGMGIMRERAASLGGILEVGAGAGGGVRIALSFPAARETA
jgi:PAS domain S-box-containing protein